MEEREVLLFTITLLVMIVDTTNDMLPAYGVRLFAGKMLLELDNDDSSVRSIISSTNLLANCHILYQYYVFLSLA